MQRLRKEISRNSLGARLTLNRMRALTVDDDSKSAKIKIPFENKNGIVDESQKVQKLKNPSKKLGIVDDSQKVQKSEMSCERNFLIESQK